MLVAAKGSLLGLELAEVGTNSVVRRKTLFLERGTGRLAQNFFHLNGPGCGAQILRRRYFPFSEEVTLHARGEGVAELPLMKASENCMF